MQNLNQIEEQEAYEALVYLRSHWATWSMSRQIRNVKVALNEGMAILDYLEMVSVPNPQAWMKKAGF